MQRTLQGVFADVSVGGSIGVASVTWMAPVADALQIIATGVAIVAGIYAIRWHKVRIKLAKEKAYVESDREPARRTSQAASRKSSGRSETSQR